MELSQHYAVAANTLEEAVEATSSDREQYFLASAQVHATLAVVEVLSDIAQELTIIRRQQEG